MYKTSKFETSIMHTQNTIEKNIFGNTAHFQRTEGELIHI